MSKRTKHTGNAEIQRANSAARNLIIGEIAEKAMDHEHRRSGRLKVTDDQLDYALERLASGDSMRNVTSQLGVNRSHLMEKASRDEEFRNRLRICQEFGAYAIVENTLNIASGGDLSSGSIERDKLMCDVAWKWGKTIGNRIFGDKLQIDQRSVNIIVDRDNADW